jgi:hypothetical protein
MIPQIGQTFTATIPPKAYALTRFRTGTSIGWHKEVTDTYTLSARSIEDNDTDREFKMIRKDGALTEVEVEWFNQRKINILN